MLSRLLFFVFMALAMPALAQNADGRYAISGIVVDMKTENPATARDDALATATRKAYDQLKERLAPEGEVLPALDDNALSRNVQNFELTGEKVSANRYIGTFTIRFRPTVAQAAAGDASSMVAGASANDVPVTFTFGNLNEWQAGKAALQNVDGVRGWQIVGLRRNYVDLVVRYVGVDANTFTTALLAQGIAANPPVTPDSRWQLGLRR
jgi:hypothetical protein